MQNVKEALLQMVKAGMKTKRMQENYLKNRLDDNPLYDIWGDINEGIYKLIGEHTEKFEDSVTFTVMNAPVLYDDRRAEILYEVYEKNFPEVKLPAPNLMNKDEMRELFKKNGGYMTPEGDWS